MQFGQSVAPTTRLGPTTPVGGAAAATSPPQRLVGFFHGNETQLILTSCVANLGAGLVVSLAPVLVVGVVSRDEQGLGSGMLNMLISLFGAIVTAGAYAFLNAHSTVLDGTAFYQDAGYAWVFWLGALVSMVALVLSLFIPPLRDPEKVDALPA
ncbi:MFS transporter [Streptomyces sp. NPDC048438]|uniref:MFS transporter n=1 Tax=Streptomyces sp. NPDC048438 TaxID=3365551 RepID=UPI0037121759